ncbi:MAG: 3-keto-5-aminohexanoate cleavage protein [Peptococcaceae bacterium]|jgi:uncharacterized protein (DUF849 family)|nr:3-keto-5-aminohexanoate cleavage protein [Peptococcaceae bacterium]MDH7525407.1 3-keto-5-aminohexanoate cleavage protein [Peptococcaceae bacterium]
MSDKRIVTAAITGAIHVPSMSEYLPITPEQIADEAVRAFEAGAAVAHIHVRNPLNGKPITDLKMFREVASSIKKRCNMVVCITTGGAPTMPVEERLSPVTELQPELASCNGGTINFALHPLAEKIAEFKFDWEKPHLEWTEEQIFPNTFKSLRIYLKTFYENRTKPEFEIYDVGQINNLAHLLERGLFKRPVYLQFIMGILGGIPATVENLVYLAETARKTIGDFQWSVGVAGKNQFKLGTVALAMGGHVRVGLEDNLWLEKGVKAKSNAEQVSKIIRIARELGIEPATPDEARQILGLKGSENVNF